MGILRAVCSYCYFVNKDHVIAYCWLRMEYPSLQRSLSVCLCYFISVGRLVGRFFFCYFFPSVFFKWCHNLENEIVFSLSTPLHGIFNYIISSFFFYKTMEAEDKCNHRYLRALKNDNLFNVSHSSQAICF